MNVNGTNLATSSALTPVLRSLHVPAVLIFVGIAAMTVIGPAIGPMRPLQAGLASDVYVGWTAGLALAVLWAVVGLRRRRQLGYVSTATLVGAVFYVAMTGTVLIASPIAYAAQGGPGYADPGGWAIVALALGLAVAVGSSLMVAAILWRLGRLTSSAIVPGVVYGAVVVVVAFLVSASM